MPLAKKVIIYLVLTLLSISFLSGCIVDDLLGSTSFSLNSWELIDNDGFAALNIDFTCDGTVNLKLINPTNSVVYSDSFIQNADAKYHLGTYRETPTAGTYELVAKDSGGNEIFSQSLTYNGAQLSIESNTQKWWKRDAWIGTYSLIELRFSVQNSGDLPAYPFRIDAVFDSKTYSADVYPCVINPYSTGFVDCFLYLQDPPTDSNFLITIYDIDNQVLATQNFTTEVEDNTISREYNWHYQRYRHINVPKAEYLNEYYLEVDRVSDEDYSLYVLDLYDDEYIEILKDIIFLGIYPDTDEDKINYMASFVQNLEYLSDLSELSDYPRFPVETIFNQDGGGDCEDKAILLISLLHSMGYNAVLLRFDEHMAVGVNLGEDTVSSYDYYVDNYYFLETTTAGKPLGFVPDGYENLASEVIIHECNNKPMLTHSWQDDHLIIYPGSANGNFIKVKCIVSNYGDITAEDITIDGAFYTLATDVKLNYDTVTISEIKPGMKNIAILEVQYPTDTITTFKTKIQYNGEYVDERESASTFPPQV
jgi:hypothetical protein